MTDINKIESFIIVKLMEFVYKNKTNHFVQVGQTMLALVISYSI